MPRKPRMYLPSLPSHVIQRGNNRARCFFRDDDYRFYKTCLEAACRRFRVRVHAYVLMTNHVHLLMTPEDASGISRVMQSVGRRYVQHINRANQRTGTLWEGRHKASLVDADAYLVSCLRYIELNPVRAGMVRRAGDYPWSSCRCLAYGAHDALVDPHAVYLSLGGDDEARRRAYRSLFDSELEAETVQAIRAAAAFSMPLGGEGFKNRVEQALGRPTGQARRGRPQATRVGE